jgi:hypothetical protein
MRARHHTSKLLLRQGTLWSGGGAWTHHAWLRRRSFHLPGLRATFDTVYEAVLLADSRRDRLDTAIIHLSRITKLVQVINPCPDLWPPGRWALAADVLRVASGGEEDAWTGRGAQQSWCSTSR